MEIAQQRLAYLNPSDTIAPYIQGGREHSDAQLPRQDSQDAAGHPALGWHPDTLHPLPSGVVHATRRHRAEDVFYQLRADRALSGHRIHPPLASEAAITLRSRQSTQIEHC